MRSLFALLLISLFSVILLPKEWTHECNHQHHETTDQHDANQASLEEDCAICDFQFSPKEQTVGMKDAPVFYTLISRIVPALVHPIMDVLDFAQGRAPPFFA